MYPSPTSPFDLIKNNSHSNGTRMCVDDARGKTVFHSFPKCLVCHHDVHPQDAVLPRPCLHGPMHVDCMAAEERLAFAAAGVTGRAPALHCTICHEEIASIAYNLCQEAPSFRLPFQKHSLTSNLILRENEHLSRNECIKLNRSNTTHFTLQPDAEIVNRVKNALTVNFQPNYRHIGNYKDQNPSKLRLNLDIHVFHHHNNSHEHRRRHQHRRCEQSHSRSGHRSRFSRGSHKITR